jgi:hypothetical protein
MSCQLLCRFYVRHVTSVVVQAVYDSCVKDNIGLDRPHWGYHCLPKIHHTDRPKPIEEKPAWMDNPKVSVP